MSDENRLPFRVQWTSDGELLTSVHSTTFDRNERAYEMGDRGFAVSVQSWDGERWVDDVLPDESAEVTVSMTVKQRRWMRQALSDAFAYYSNDSDDSWPMDVDNRERIQGLASEVFGFGSIDN